MSANQSFGGSWTEEKLNLLAKYLHAYTMIFTRNPKARFFRTVYVDAFAGAGYILRERGDPSQKTLFADLLEDEAQSYVKGSALRALEVEPSFNEYLFIDEDGVRCAELERLKEDHPGKSITIERANANEYLPMWCRSTNWQDTRAVVFLDPYGMEVEWALLEEIAGTKAIDLWFLFPLGIGVMRLLTKREKPPEAWARRLTRILGTEQWMREFYSPTAQQELFDASDPEERQADYKAVARFFLKRLKEIFVAVADRPYVLKNSRKTPLYLFCFAAGNPKGAPTAVKIAQQIIGE